MVSKATVLMAVTLGGGAGFLGSRLAAPAQRPEADGELATLQARVSELESGRERPPSLEGRANPAPQALPAPGAPGAVPAEINVARLEAALLELLKDPSPELRLKLAELAKAPPADKADGKSPPPDGGQKAVAALVAGVDTEVERWKTAYDLSDGQADELKAFARRALERAADAKRDGATAQQLVALDIEAQAEIRRIVGDPVYTATERARITADARKSITWVAAAVGLTPAQHTQVDRILSESVEQILPDVVRARSVSLPEGERAAIQANLEQRRTAGWERFRTDVLTEEQRRRLPTGK